MTSPLIVANNVASQLVTNIGPSDTAVLVAAGQGARFPSPSGGQYFYVTAVHYATGAVEVMKCTSRALDTLTVVRGQDGTTAISLVTGSVLEMREVAVIFQEIDFRTLANTANGALVLDGSGLVPDARIPAAITRDTELNAAIAGVLSMIPSPLGFTPVQQGTGVGQLANVVKIGWKSGNKLGLTIDASDMGNIALESWRGAANGVAELDGSSMVPIGRIPALGYLPTAGGAMTGALTSNSDINTSAVMQAASSFRSAGTTAIVGTTGAGNVYLRPNGIGSATGELQLSSAGIASTVNFTATSDERLKHQITPEVPRADLLDQIHFYSFKWIDNGRFDLGVIAQEVQRLFPEYVHANDDGMLGVDKASLSIELVLALLTRVQRLEEALKAK